MEFFKIGKYSSILEYLVFLFFDKTRLCILKISHTEPYLKIGLGVRSKKSPSGDFKACFSELSEFF